MTRVLLLTNMYPPHHYGGYELTCRDVVDHWRRRGHEVTVLTTDWRVHGVRDPDDEAHVRRVLRFYWDDHQVVTASLHRRFAIQRSNVEALRRAVSEVCPDVVSVWAMGAMSLGLLTEAGRLGLPLVYVCCDDWLDYGPQVDGWARSFAHRPRLARAVAAVSRMPTTVEGLERTGTFCFVSDFVRRRAERSAGATFPDSTVVYSGIDPTDFPSTGERAEPWNWRLLQVGRIDARKGIDVAIKALALLPEVATLDVVGRGDDRHLAELRTLARRLGVAERVRFSVAERNELRHWYGSADALLFPVRWEEPFGLVPLEALACGTPVVATCTGGSGEFLIDGATCLEVPIDDPVAIADRLHRLASDGEMVRQLVAGGRRMVAELTVERLADHLETWHVAASVGFVDGRPADRPPLAGIAAV